MSRIRIVLVLAVAGILSAGLLSAAFANGTAQPGAEGRGPTEAAAALSVASVTAIEQRGHVNNMCEAGVMTEELIRQRGGQQTSGDYTVVYLLDPPKGWYEMSAGQLIWRAPAMGENQHIEAVVMDSLTKKPIPVQGINITVMDQQGRTIQSQPLGYYWHPMADHYGANFVIPAEGTYTLRVTAPAPAIRRHDKAMGNRFTQPINVTFNNVKITPKAAPPEERASTDEPAVTPASAGAGTEEPRVVPVEEKSSNQ